ncbi:MAG: asparagine synthase (glutamine-hydrolyzing) [Anaeroplasma sp.]
MIKLCGIVYKSNFHNGTNYNDFISACDTLNHRGPDDFGYLFTKYHSFGHKRLSIIDIKNGKQPMSILNNHLIYNGELYNTSELIKHLKIKPEFNSDTLVLLRLLIEQKEQALKHLNGIFSFVYTYDEEVLAVRDMFGVKPLYYTLIDNDLFIASEIKAILAYTHEAIVNKDGLCELLGMGPSHSEGKTIYKGIYELPPGYYIRFNKNGLSLSKYYELPVYKYTKSYQQAVLDIKNLVNKAINKQMISDVGVSSFLSGGLDSSIISTIMAKSNVNLDTYTVDYEGNKEEFKPNAFEISRDLDYAKLVSESIKSNLHTVLIDNETLVNNLKRAVIQRDSPGMTDIDSSMILLADTIKQNHKVALSGECADELFAGYSWYYLKSKEKNTFPWIRNLDYRESLLNNKWRSKLKLKEYVSNEYKNAKSKTPLLATDTENEKKHRIMTYLNIKYFMTNLLERKDRMTMGSSIEVRVPFCDKDLVELLYNIPYKYKYRSKVEKKLLRDAFSNEVISDVITRKKSPYPKSMSKDYTEMVKSLLFIALEDKTSVLYELFDINKIRELIDTDKELETPWYGQLMRKTALMAYLYQIHYWYKKYNVRIEE